MKKRLIAIATLAALPAISFAGGATVSGFADIKYTADEEKSYFGANAEVDVQNKMSDKVSVRVDTDLMLGTNDSTGNSATVEQAYFDFAAAKTVTVRGGVFNNPIGMQAEDSIDRTSLNSDRIHRTLDGATALYGNNVAGVAAIASVGPATIIVGALNDIGHNDLTENSYALVAAISPVKGLDVELGLVTQAEKNKETSDKTAGMVTDLNIKYSVAGATIGFDYLTAEEAIDSAMVVNLGYMVTKKIGASVLYDTVKAKGGDTTTAMGIGGSYKLADNLKVKAEYFTTNEVGDSLVEGDDDDRVNLKFLASF